MKIEIETLRNENDNFKAQIGSESYEYFALENLCFDSFNFEKLKFELEMLTKENLYFKYVKMVK